ncbi:MAG: hypothetical protein V4515_14435 [Chloroflexota bacterium]
MTKENGLGASVAIDNSAGTPATLSNDITQFELATPRAVQDVTGVDKFAIERLLLLADGSFSPQGVFNDAATFSHVTLKTIPSTSVLRTVTIGHSGQTLAMEMLGTDYALTRAATGELTWQAPFVLADGTVPTWS